MQIIAFILFLSTFTEGLVEYLFAKESKYQPYLKYVALVIGIALAFAYRIDIPAMLGAPALAVGVIWVGYLISGIAIGRGSNYLNDLIGKLKNE